MASNFHGFELLIGSYAVAHLRVAQRVLESGGELPADGVNVYLTDTLESPHAAPPGLAHAPLFHRKLAEENQRARRVKSDVPILVCLGNPPYFRQVIDTSEEGVERLGGWVREGDESEDGILQDFIRDAPPVHVKNLYNLYVYFWRWALWKVFEHSPNRGIVSFITASSYLRGPGFAGMRKFMRQTFDDLWIIDLGGEGRGARLSENVFAIQTPVAIAVGVRYADADPSTPARVRYARIDGTREEKYSRLEAIKGFGDLGWHDCFSDWTDPFIPYTDADYFSWPALTDLFPWQHSGVQFKRTWPIAPDRATLVSRWEVFAQAPVEDRRGLFRETRDRKVDRTYPELGGGNRLPRLVEVGEDDPVPTPVPYAYRSFDRQHCLLDNRLGDFLRPALWTTAGARQLYLTSLLTDVIGAGPAVVVSNLVPDMHHFSGRGGKDTLPLWRNAEATAPNLPGGVLEALGKALAREIEPEELFAYCYAVLSAPGYVVRFLDELEVPGPHVPLSRDAALFERGNSLGRRLIWLHTYGERMVPVEHRAGEIPQGKARSVRGVGTSAGGYPTSHSYDEEKRELQVGDGVFAPVTPEARRYSVSGLDVIGSWLDYRMRDGAGRRSSNLDKIRPTTWPAQFTEELLRLLWVVEHTVALGPELDETLALIIDSETFRADELPTPTDAERQPPS
ncbi:MAG: type ISP restriction/modification enzyme [Gaiellaceae bacterium]